jgi:hypothetical protein
MPGFPIGPLRLYYERRSKTYLIVDHTTGGFNGYDAICEVMSSPNPKKPCLTAVDVVPRECTRTSWIELPKVWQDSLAAWVKGSPLDHPSLWRTGELKVMRTPRHELPLLIGSISPHALRVLERRLKGELP